MGKINIRLNLSLIVITVILVVIQVLLLNSHSTIGDRLTAYSQEIENIQRENAKLSKQIASVSAMNMIAERAKNLNLTTSLPLFSFTAPIPFAYNFGPSL